MTKITPPEEYVDQTFGTDLHPDMRRILAYLAPQPAWVTTATLKLCVVHGARHDRAVEQVRVG